MVECTKCIHFKVCQSCGVLTGRLTSCDDYQPKIVRCKDCVHRFEAFKPEIENGGGICMKMYDTGKIEGHLCRVKADDFCSHGKRRSHHDSLCDQTEEGEA